MITIASPVSAPLKVLWSTEPRSPERAISSSKDLSRINWNDADDSAEEPRDLRRDRIPRPVRRWLRRNAISRTPSFVAASGKLPDISLWKTPLISSRDSEAAGNRKPSPLSEPNFTWAAYTRPRDVVLPEFRSPTITTRGIGALPLTSG